MGPTMTIYLGRNAQSGAESATVQRASVRSPCVLQTLSFQNLRLGGMNLRFETQDSLRSIIE